VLEQLKAAGEIKGYGSGINEAPMIGRFLDRLELDFLPGRDALHPA